jgi:hydroxymethylpyrimidine kinase/phosphomethylpyrimidine kinase
MVANILSIAGTDQTAGAGIQADLKTFSALGCYGLTVVTSIVAQNTLGVKRFESVSTEMISDQLDAVFEDVRIDGVKIGMVANTKIASVIVDRLKFYKVQHIVLDPVMIATSHHSLIEENAVDAIKEHAYSDFNYYDAKFTRGGNASQHERSRKHNANARRDRAIVADGIWVGPPERWAFIRR